MVGASAKPGVGMRANMHTAMPNKPSASTLLSAPTALASGRAAVPEASEDGAVGRAALSGEGESPV